MGKKDDLFNFGTEDLSAISAGFDKQIDALGATDRELAKARVFCIRGKFSDALKIYESVVDEEVENVGGYIGIVRVHSKNFTVYDGAEIEKDIDIVRQIARGQNVKDEEYAEYLDARKKYFDKIAEEKKKKAEAEKLTKQKAAEEMQRKAAAAKEAEKKKREETIKLYFAEEYEKAFPDILRYAEQGDSEFWFKAGYCYATGKGVKQDKQKAAFWYEKSAAQGNKYAQANLGHMYYFGSGIEQSFIKAVPLFMKAAEQGNAMSQYYVAICYQQGHYVRQDLAKAKYWYQKAAAQGYEDAKIRLKTLESEL